MLGLEVSYYICSNQTTTTNLLSSCPTRSREHFNISSMQILSFRVELPLSLPIQRAHTQALPPPSTTDQEIKIIQGITYSSKNLLHAGHRYSKDGKLLTDGRQSWRCASTPSMRHSTVSESHTTILLMLQIPTPNKLSTKSSRWHPLIRPPTTGSTVL